VTSVVSRPPAVVHGLARPTFDELYRRRYGALVQIARLTTGSAALAEEIVQDAFARNLEHVDDVRESAVGWFYRVLRNAVIDRQRRMAVQSRRLDELAAELRANEAIGEEVRTVACRCITNLAAALKPEYADALERIEVEGVAVKDYAEAKGLTANNAAVRIFRAREALRKQVAKSCGTCAEHGCLDCTCNAGAAPASSG
jgi:RNA polymerase sigma factor (sigma-70 family)